MSKRVLIVGGVAGGMSCAARIKRLDSSVEVVVFERGAHVSYANCGLPYYIGGIISERDKLLVQTPERLRGRYGIDVRTRHEVVSIDRKARTIEVKNLDNGETRTERYDALVLATGGSPVVPPIPGADGPNVHVLHDVEDTDRLYEATRDAKRVCVVGAGYIGLELVENFRHRGMQVTLVELQDQVLPLLDREMAQLLLEEIERHEVEVLLGRQVEAVTASGVRIGGGAEIACDVVCLAVGVRPNSQLARDAGLSLGARGHVRVDEHLRTDDADIYAVGDVAEVYEFGTGEPLAVPLAGPANRQGRIAADNICGRDSVYRGTQGTAIVRAFALAAGLTGRSEKQLKTAGAEYRKIYLHPTQHAGYYPDAKLIDLKVLFAPDGRILGAQAVGEEGVDGVINVLATAMRAQMPVQDLEHLELAYSPQWGAAKHAINMVGFVGGNVLSGDVEMVEPENVPDGLYLLDVRTPAEVACGVIEGAATIPLDELRERVDEIPRDRVVGVYCAAGLRGYIGYRILKQAGFNARNINGGYRTWRAFRKPSGT
jgi:NADPH-dependent 2,4-dienoyl-CoA reductase/sulfur reductase-like enzyme/rhodanese-related sulfurtransferase